MKRKATYLVAALILGACLLIATGCASTKTQNGVTIEKNRSWNPLDYVPGL